MTKTNTLNLGLKTKNEAAKSMPKKAKLENVKAKDKTKKIILSVLISIAAALVLVSGLVFAYDEVYAEKIYPGVKVAGSDLSDKTKSEAKKYLEAKSANLNQIEYNVNVNNDSKSVKAADLFFSADVDKSIENAYKYGREGNVFQNIKNQFNSLYHEKNLNYVLNFDQEKLTATLRDLANDEYKEAKNASIKVVGKQAEVENEQAGKDVNVSDFEEQINDSLTDKKYNLTLNWETIEPTIKQKQVEAILPQVQTIINDNINFKDTEKNKTYTANPNEISSWLTLKLENDNSVSVQVSDDATKNYIQENLAKTINKKMIDKKINSQTKAVISEGQDGRTLDENKTLEGIKNILSKRIDNQAVDNNINLTISTQERGEKEVAPQEAYTSGGTPGLAEGKYIEVNLSTQTMYLYTGEQFGGSYRVSTGKWSMPTPVGTRYIQDKNPKAWSAEYGLYMPYWNGIGGGYGIHELPEWPGGAKEGESHLGTPVSHGCIRLGVGAAAAVYDWAPVGTPVFIHK